MSVEERVEPTGYLTLVHPVESVIFAIFPNSVEKTRIIQSSNLLWWAVAERSRHPATARIILWRSLSNPEISNRDWDRAADYLGVIDEGEKSQSVENWRCPAQKERPLKEPQLLLGDVFKTLKHSLVTWYRDESQKLLDPEGMKPPWQRSPKRKIISTSLGHKPIIFQEGLGSKNI